MKAFLFLLVIVILSGVTSAKPVAAKDKDMYKLLDALLALQKKGNDDRLFNSSAHEQHAEYEFEQVLEQEDDNRAALNQNLAKLNKIEAEAQFWRNALKTLAKKFIDVWLQDN